MPYTPTYVLPEQLDMMETANIMSGNSELRKKQFPLNNKLSLFGKANNGGGGAQSSNGMSANVAAAAAAAAANGNSFSFPDGGWVCCQCQNYNFSGRVKCNRCQKQKTKLDYNGKPRHLLKKQESGANLCQSGGGGYGPDTPTLFPSHLYTQQTPTLVDEDNDGAVSVSNEDDIQVTLNDFD